MLLHRTSMVKPSFIYGCDVVRVVDADTFELRIDLGFRASLRLHCRLRDVNAPELSTPEGQSAKAAVEALLSGVGQLTVQSYKDQQSFARWIVDVYVDGRSLADVLVERGLAVRTRP